MDIGNLRHLINLVKEKVNTLNKNEFTIIRPTLKIANLQITENGSSYSTQIVNEKIRDTIHIHSLINEIKNTVEFKAIVEEIVKNYSLPKKYENPVPQMTFWLETFLYKIAVEEFEDRFNENREIEMIMNLRNELEEGPLLYTSEMYLGGIFLETSELILDNGIIIRKPTNADIEQQLSSDAYGGFSFMHFIPTIIVVVSKKTKDQIELYEVQERLLSILRLFRLGSVYSDSSRNKNNSVLWTTSMGTSAPVYKPAINNKYTIKESELNDLIKFYKAIKDLVPSDRQVNADKKFSSVKISLSRYSNALLEPVEPERRILTSLIGLEALYTQDGEKGETSYRLALRLAKLLGFVGLKPIDIKNDLGKCYSIRNKVGHGILLEDKERQDAAKYVDRLQNYLRQSIVLFIFCLREKSKGEIIDWIDRSMVDSNSSQDLQKWINEKLSDVPRSVIV